MKVLKIIGAFFFSIFGLIAIIPTNEADPMPALGIPFLVLAGYLIYTIIRADRKKRNSADDYYQEKVAEADRYYQEKVSTAEQRCQEEEARGNAKREALEKDICALTAELTNLQQESLVQATKVADYSELRSDEIKNALTLLQNREAEAVKSGEAVKANGRQSQQKTQEKQILRCFNAECAGLIAGVSIKNADRCRERIAKSFETINRIFLPDGVQISPSYLSMKLDELSLVYQFMVKQEEEKEQRRAIREQMVEEEKVRREIEREKQKIEKEEAQFSNEIKKLMSYMQKAKDEVEKKLYIDKINELEEKLKVLEADKENVLQREQNTRAGFVYIISNIGSFGEDVFKIGMTRRLEPMDRIAELSSASVPFPFDVHAMIFSEDAPALEAVLHQHFDQQRVNRVNPRKEFFRVNLDEIKKVVLENHNATVQFVDIPDAVEYRETLMQEERKQ